MPGRPLGRGCFGARLRAGQGAGQNHCKSSCENVKLRDHAFAPTRSDAPAIAGVAVFRARNVNSPQSLPRCQHYTVPPRNSRVI